MPNSDSHDATQDKVDQNHIPPPGYPPIDGQTPPTKKNCCPRTTKKGDRGFIEGCLFALCCCWLCEECF